LGIWDQDPESDTLWWSDETYRIFGLEPQSREMDFDSFLELVHPADRPRIIEQTELALDNPQHIYRCEYRIQRPGGSERTVFEEAVVRRDHMGEAQRITGIIQDITDRKRAEEDLRESRRRYRQMFQESPVPMFMQDYSEAMSHIRALEASGVADLRQYLEEHPAELQSLLGKIKFLYVNKAALELYEADQGELSLRTLADLAPAGSSHHLIDQLQAFSNGATSFSGRGRNQTLKGNTLDLQVKKVVVAGHEHDFSHILTTILDLTESKRIQREKQKMESQLRQAQKMEAVGTLAGGIAHDFNNILAAITGYSELALESYGEGADPSQEIGLVINSAGRARELVRKILAFSRKANIELRPLNINQVITDWAQIIERTIPRMIKIELRLDSDLKTINGDPNQIEQVLFNLASNAQDAMPNGGSLAVQTGNIHLDQDYAGAHLGAKAGNYVLMSVSDTGAGMDKECSSRIFEPFYTTKEVGKGTGLGLASVYGIVKSHGGYITCDSELDNGTTFKVYWPVLNARAKPVQAGRNGAEAVRGGHETILVTDDEEHLRDIASRILERQGYQVKTANNGEEALALYQESDGDIGLVILDVSMPGMGGHRCLLELLKLNPAAKVIIASGYSRQVQLKDTLKSGAAGFIAKPFRKKELLVKVRAVLDGRPNPIP
jgi:PAS domain S-box-containing protein